MLFSQAKTIIFLAKNSLKAYQISLKGSQAKIEKELEKDLTAENLAAVFQQIKKEFKTRSVRILLPESKTYLKLLDLPLSAGVTRETILSKAQEVIPEKLADGYFDWKKVGETKHHFRVQVLAVNKNYLEMIQAAAQQVGLNLEAFESPAFALARLTTQEKEAHLLVSQAERSLLVAAFQGRVFGALTVDDQSQVEAKKQELIDFVKDKWGIVIKKIISENLNPVLGLALKEDIKGQDEKVLNLTPPKIVAKLIKKRAMEEEEKPVEAKPDEVKPAPPAGGPVENQPPVWKRTPRTFNQPLTARPVDSGSSQSKKLIGVVIVVVVLAIIFGGVYVSRRALQSRQETASTPTPTQALGPTATPEPADKRGDFKIKVLNGSGEAGAAGVAVQFLKDKGYPEEIEAGNADSYDYEETVIQVAEGNEEVFDLVANDLKDEYSVASEAGTLDEDSEFDAIIIVGAG